MKPKKARCASSEKWLYTWTEDKRSRFTYIDIDSSPQCYYPFSPSMFRDDRVYLVRVKTEGSRLVLHYMTRRGGRDMVLLTEENFEELYNTLT